MQKIAKPGVPKQLAGFCLMAALVGCDGNSTDKPKQKTLSEHPSGSHRPALKARIEVPDKLHERSTVAFSGASSSTANGVISSFEWKINTRAYQGDQITLIPHNDSAELVVGELTESLTITMSLTVTTDSGDSDTTSIFATIEEVDVDALPAMPKNRDTKLLGIDIDNDGVRDDIEIAIYKRFPLEIEKREISRKAAKTFNELLNFGVQGKDADANEYAKKLANVEQCYSSSGHFVNGEGQKAMQFLQALMFNTRERIAAEKQFMRKLSGIEPGQVDVSDENCRLPQN